MGLEQFIKESIREIVREEIRSAIADLQQSQPNKVMRVKEAAAYLNIAVCRMYELANHPRFPVIREGRKLLFLQKDLEAWLEAQKEVI
ncbi:MULTISPECIES: helix-turn-helix domain-containing protein [Bacillus cereus group]|uniref:Excisionase family DNA binding domain-containing protein n=1 Tax=Bacillus cereus (strain VD014) TaxID=1053223 RepID=A0A9W5NQ22_BACC8|nr:helix-turn-helix domain-containing protein [Bacillus cereus]EJR22334.1 excisionase family DNA binding domain-containing protein [Bacillus cereus VD014]MCU4937426.1 helix-turn-helix domain-containing protein [Bacillus cereus]MCU5512235.1 helix-turn-helix domain-containing protein [Bacillus cereus]HDR4863233.1 helix-turn-helix domain-containing protein [Bacillus cereus]HDR8156342.1 helix-turn-helix domain-containing protein [Bacillus cereus]